MKFERTDSFKSDFKRLGEREREMFRQTVREINEAYERRGNRALPVWPAGLRIRDVEGVKGIFEMTWSFSGPDGRATFEYVVVDGEPAIRWRRIGDHRVFASP